MFLTFKAVLWQEIELIKYSKLWTRLWTLCLFFLEPDPDGKKGKVLFSLWKLVNLLVGVFCIQHGGLVEKVIKAGCKPDPNVTSLFLRLSRKRQLITADSSECV